MYIITSWWFTSRIMSKLIKIHDDVQDQHVEITMKTWYFLFIRGYVSCQTCFWLMFRVHWHVLMCVLSFHDDSSIELCQNESRFMMLCKINTLKSRWKHDTHLFARGYLSCETCFRLMFRMYAHVWIHITSFHDDLSIGLCQNESRFMMMYKINILKLWWK